MRNTNSISDLISHIQQMAAAASPSINTISFLHRRSHFCFYSRGVAVQYAFRDMRTNCSMKCPTETDCVDNHWFSLHRSLHKSLADDTGLCQNTRDQMFDDMHINCLVKCPRDVGVELRNNDNRFLLQGMVNKFLAAKIVSLLVGSFIFVMGLSVRPVLARKSISSVETVSGYVDEEEEEMHMRCLEKCPRDVDTLKVVFYVKMRKGKTKEALEYVERLISLEPKEVEWRLLKGLCCDMAGDLSMAKRVYRDILEEQPVLLRALHGLAIVMHKINEGQAVFEMLNKALEVARREKRFTEEMSIRILIAQMHAVMGELEHSLKVLEDLVDENPRDFRLYLCQGVVYSLLGKKKEADEQFVTYRSLVHEEFPQKGFLDDIVLAAKAESEFKSDFSN